LSEALRAFRHEAVREDEDSMPWLWLACPVAPEPVAAELWDDDTWFHLATRAVQLARDSGALAVLPLALSYRAGVHVHAGEFADAEALLEESISISQATGAVPLPYTSLLLTAWSGDAVRASQMIHADAAAARARGDGRAVGLAAYAAAVLHNGLGEYEAALTSAQLACQHEDMGFFGWALVELVEAAARTGERATAEMAMRRLDERTVASGTHWALGVRARSRALLSEPDVAEALYRESIKHLEACRMAAHLARARLTYGEWLRREGRRRDAREQLRTAHEMFVRFGAHAFAERSRIELVATGQIVRRRASGGRDDLTAQESQIAALAAAGRTNIEIAGQLFISPRTVEYHLSHIFAKLGIRSRRMLRRTSETVATIGSPT
jgi:DNA-binding CsgD family transcriptional regulator